MASLSRNSLSHITRFRLRGLWSTGWLAIAAASLAAALCGGQARGAAASNPQGQARANPLGLTVSNVQVGLAGFWKTGFWTTVWIDVTCDAPFRGQIVVEVPDGDGTPSQFGRGELTTLAAGAHRVQRLAKMGRSECLLRVLAGRHEDLSDRDSNGASNRDGGQKHAALQPAPLQPLWEGRLEGEHGGRSAESRWTVSLGPESGLARAVERRPLSYREGFHLTSILASDAPRRWEGLEAVDSLIVTTSDPQFDLNAEQIEAVQQWVRMGGHLIFSGGRRAEELTGAGGAWQLAAPGAFERVTQEPRGGGIESLAQAQQQLRDFSLAHYAMPESRGVVLASIDSKQHGPRPAVVRRPWGFGQLTFAAFDLDVEPLASWPDRPALVERLVQAEFDKADEHSDQGQVRHVGYNDLSGQLRSALDQFPADEHGRGVTLIRFSVVILILLVYALLLGPGDYFLLKRLGRLSHTWVTFPLLVAVACGSMAWLQSRMKDDLRRLNQVDLVDVDLESGFVRGTTWAQLYVPAPARVTVAGAARGVGANSPGENSPGENAPGENAPGENAPGENAPGENSPAGNPPDAGDGGMGDGGMLVSWQGLPGASLGGMDAPLGLLLRRPAYQIGGAGQGEVDGMWLESGGSQAFSARWWLQSGLTAEASDLKAFDGRLDSGGFSNPLEIDLEDCLLAYGTWAYQLEGGRLRAGERVSVDGLTRRVLSARLTRRRAVKEKTDFAVTPWDPASRDVARVLEMMMFHRLAGGVAYTRLKNRYQRYVDQAGQLQAGRALLVGRAERPAVDIRCNGESPPGSRWVVYRIVLPVGEPEL